MPVKNILIAVPTTGGLMKSKTALTLVALVKRLTREGINVDYRTLDSADIVIARNYFANLVLDTPQIDALLFVDSDMQFRPQLVMRMLALDVEASAAAYTQRVIDMPALAKAIARHGSLEKACAESSDFNVLTSWDNTRNKMLKMRKGFATMAAVGLGCALIMRSALQAMVDEKAVNRHLMIVKRKKIENWGFFDPLLFDEATLGEDYSFWHRWTNTMGRKLWVCIDEEVQHLGEYPYSAKYELLLNKRPMPEKITEEAAS